MIRLIGRISDVCGAAAILASFGLVAVTMFEVTSRYAFHAPTVWAFDISYMLNGAIFVLAMAMTLRLNQHVSIDIFSKAIPERWFRVIEITIFLCLILPAISLVTYAGWGEFWKAWVSDLAIPVDAGHRAVGPVAPDSGAGFRAGRPIDAALRGTGPCLPCHLRPGCFRLRSS